MLVSLIHFCRRGHVAQAQDHRSRNAARVIPTWPTCLGNPITEFQAESFTLAILAGAVDRSHGRRRTQTLQGGGPGWGPSRRFHGTQTDRARSGGDLGRNGNQPGATQKLAHVREMGQSGESVSSCSFTPGRLSKEVTWATITRPEPRPRACNIPQDPRRCRNTKTMNKLTVDLEVGDQQGNRFQTIQVTVDPRSTFTALASSPPGGTRGTCRPPKPTLAGPTDRTRSQSTWAGPWCAWRARPSVPAWSSPKTENPACWAWLHWAKPLLAVDPVAQRLVPVDAEPTLTIRDKTRLGQTTRSLGATPKRNQGR